MIGDNESLVRERITQISTQFLQKESGHSMALERYRVTPGDAKDTVDDLMTQVIESVKTPPIFSKRKVVSLEAFNIDKGKDLSGSLFFQICSSAANSQLQTFLIHWSQAVWNPNDLELNKDLYRVERCDALDNPKPLKVRAIEKIKSLGKRIQDKDLDEWLKYCESEEEFWKALDQIVLSLGSNIEISRIQLEPYLNLELEKDSFALSNALMARDLPRVLQLLYQYLDYEDELPQALVGRVLSFFLQLNVFDSVLKRVPFEASRFRLDRNGLYDVPAAFLERLRSEARAGVESELFSKHPYVLKLLFSAALRYPRAKINDALVLLGQLDARLKSVSLEPRYVIEEALIDLMTDKRGKALAVN